MMAFLLRHRRLFSAAGFVLALVAVFAVGCSTSNPNRVVGQPHLGLALDHLNSARVELQAATSFKGDQRTKAMSIIDEAIKESELSLEHEAGK
jgi:hypothetical protein